MRQPAATTTTATTTTTTTATIIDLLRNVVIVFFFFLPSFHLPRHNNKMRGLLSGGRTTHYREILAFERVLFLIFSLS